MLKAFYLLNLAGKAGTEWYMETLMKYLSTDGLVQPFFVYNKGGSLAERLEAIDALCRWVGTHRRLDKKAIRGLAELHAKWDIDLVHYYYLWEHYTTLPAKKHNKKICVVYTNRSILANDFVTRFSNRIMDWRWDQTIAVCSKEKRQLIANGWSADRIQIIFDAVDLDAWVGDRSQSTLRAELGLDDSRFVTLCASQFTGNKGHKYLINLVKRLTELCAVLFTLMLAGDDSLPEPAKAQVQELGPEDHVKFIGFRKDIKNSYKGSDLYVSSLQHEVLPLLIIEAITAGLPVTTTDTGGNSNIVNDKVRCDTLVEYDNPDSMAVTMRCLSEDSALTARCRENACRTVEDRFEIHKMVRATYGTYEKALHD